eukprot:TRINITY_DN5547_c0_g1_i8.p3 TRINITY_DN5547_c0_g1~~TRINITY_DN5547_c0_g1_i8.p3  ORF type:complete len:130 (+),score=24.97 TRINITY_DN5547_c0_g1_i8:61-450(+)
MFDIFVIIFCFFLVLQFVSIFFFFFFFNDTATTEIYTLHIVGSVRCVQETDAEYRGWLRLFNKNTALCKHESGRIGCDACPVRKKKLKNQTKKNGDSIQENDKEPSKNKAIDTSATVNRNLIQDQRKLR